MVDLDDVSIEEIKFEMERRKKLESKKVINGFLLNIQHYDGEQTLAELSKPCEKCLFRVDTDCSLFDLPTRESQRPCISNYRIDRETLVGAMREKLEKDSKEFGKWVNSFSDFVGPEDGKLYVVDSPEVMVQVHKDLEKMLGE